MQILSKSVRTTVLALVFAAAVGQSANASVEVPRGPRGGFLERIRHFIVQALDEMSIPPG